MLKDNLCIKVIKRQRELGMDILEGIKAIVQIRKVQDFDYVKINFDQDEEFNKSLKLFGSLLVMDGEQVVVVICQPTIPIEVTTYAIEIAFWLFQHVGFVEMSKCKDTSPMVMFRWRWAREFKR